MSIADNKQDFLYKKNLGVVASQGPNVSYQSETAGNARSRIISNLQLFSQPIPQNAPTDLGPKKYVKADGSLETDNGLGLGTVQTSNTYPYIQYVDSLKLSTASKYAYYFNNPGVSTNTNLLSNAVPYNYNPSNTSWAYKVTSSGYAGNVDPSLYIVDTDAGYLYFVNTTDWDSQYGTPSISFYRYNGTMGIPTNLGNFAGAYGQGTGAIAYGDRAGYTGQGANAIAMGNLAGAYGQGTGSIAIGHLAGPTGMSANSIVLNASGTALYGTGPTGGFYVAPVGSYSGSTGPFTLLAYGADKQIVGITGDALTALGIVGSVAGGVGGGVGGGANYNIGNDVILSGSSSAVPTPQRPNNDDGGFYVSPVLGYTGSSSTTFNVLGYGSNDKEVITLPITLDTKDVLMPMAINNNLQLPTLVPGNLTYINNSGLLTSTDVTSTQFANMSGVNPTNSIAIGNGAGAGANMLGAMNSVAIGNGAGADVSVSNGTYKKWLTPSVVANNNITGVAMSASGQIQLYALNLTSSNSSNIYKSVDRGSTFLPIPTSVFPSISSEYRYVVSANGTCIIAFRHNFAGVTNFYISSNSGVTLTNAPQAFTQAPLSFAINTDGSYIMLVSTGGIYVTNKTNLNFGSSKATITASSASCAMTPDGKHMRAIINGTAMYTSSDYGVTTFIQVAPSGLPTSNLSLIAISGTGLYQLVSTTNKLYVSTNTGGTFASKLSNTNPSITIISSIAVSLTGQYMIACCSSSSVKGYVYYSTNFGENWQIMTALEFDFFNSCAISEDGIFFTVSTPSNVYTLDNNLIGNSVAIGNGAGQVNQLRNSVAIGNGAGQLNQASNTVAIGNGAGQLNQASNTVAIGSGAGQTNQPANTIAINASGTALNPSMSNGCYIAPIADVSNSTSTVFNLLGYGSDNQVVKSNVFINSTGNSIINNYSPTKEDIGYFLKAGNASFYIGDDYSSLPTGSVTTYGRYFGTGGNIYQDFSGSFIWRRVTNVSNALGTSVSCMTLNNTGDLSTTGNIQTYGNITASHIISTGIGIGTTSPGFTLDVNGNVRFTLGIRIDSGTVNCRGAGNGNGLLLNHASGGTCEIYNGGVDTFNPTGINNLMIRSWNGIGFQSYDNTVRVAIDTRGGNISATGNITATGNISAGNVYSNSVSIYKIPIHSRNHQTIGLRVPTSGVYLVSALGESTGWYNFAILGVNTSGNVVASNALIPISNIYLNISNFEVTMAIPGGYDWLGENYKISVTRI